MCCALTAVPTATRLAARNVVKSRLLIDCPCPLTRERMSNAYAQQYSANGGIVVRE
jgi:hypothetical protein